MPSAPPGRYQSRLFNFVNRQSQRLTDQYDRAVRQLKVAAVWGVQILLYPVYLMVQAGLSAGRQLAESAEAGWPQFKALTNTQPQAENVPEVDTPIQRVLEAVDTFLGSGDRSFSVSEAGRSPEGVGSGDKENNEDKGTINSLSCFPNHQSLIAHPPSPVVCQPGAFIAATQNNLSQTSQKLSQQSCLIQGVATLLKTRALVLITVDNQILDILTPQQQRQLSSKISWEIADLGRQWRLAAASASRQLTQLRFSSLETKPRVLAPVRFFWHLMAWVQTSPVAIAANLFQEATLVESISPGLSLIQPRRPTLRPQHPQPLLKEQEMIPQLVPQSALAFLDRTVAELESHQLIPGSEVVVSLSERTTRAIKERTQKLRQQLQTPLIKSDHQAESSEVSPANDFGIKALIYAAVEYFFGRQQSLSLPRKDSQEQPSIEANPQAEIDHLSGRTSNYLPSSTDLSSLKFEDSTETDPWLSWDDLYGNPQRANQAQNPTSPPQEIIKKKSPAQLPEAFSSQKPIKPGNSILSVIKRYLGFNQPSGQLSAPRTSEVSIEEPATLVIQTPAQLNTRAQNKSITQKKRTTSSADVVKSSSTKSLPDQTAASAITTSSSDRHLDAAPDWIETPATPNGYVKHPLEQLLGWLDGAMLWLEELVVKVWRWVRGR